MEGSPGIHSTKGTGVPWTSDRDASASWRLLVAGDLCPHGRSQDILSGHQLNRAWQTLSGIFEDHALSVVNLECPLTDSTVSIVKSGPSLHASPRCAAGIRAVGFDVVTLANNHIMDRGERGLLDTLQACQNAGLQTVGAGRNLAEATQPLNSTVNGTRVAILTFSEYEFSSASEENAGAWPLDLPDNYRQIFDATKCADFVLVIIHGGNEYYNLPSPRLVKTCRFFAEIGADAIVCHHSHVASGTEQVGGVPIIYGTGNFLFDWPEAKPKWWYEGYMVSFQIKNGKLSDTVLIPYEQCKLEPGVNLMQSDQASVFLDEVARLGNIIKDQKSLAAAWKEFGEQQRSNYLARLLSWTKLDDYLWSHNLLPTSLIKTRVPDLLNLVRCEAHHDVLVEVLQQAYDDLVTRRKLS